MSNRFRLADDAPWLFTRVMESSSSAIIVDDIFTNGNLSLSRLATTTPHERSRPAKWHRTKIFSSTTTNFCAIRGIRTEFLRKVIQNMWDIPSERPPQSAASISIILGENILLHQRNFFRLPSRRTFKRLSMVMVWITYFSSSQCYAPSCPTAERKEKSMPRQIKSPPRSNLRCDYVSSRHEANTDTRELLVFRVFVYLLKFISFEGNRLTIARKNSNWMRQASVWLRKLLLSLPARASKANVKFLFINSAAGFDRRQGPYIRRNRYSSTSACGGGEARWIL